MRRGKGSVNFDELVREGWEEGRGGERRGLRVWQAREGRVGGREKGREGEGGGQREGLGQLASC